MSHREGRKVFINAFCVLEISGYNMHNMDLKSFHNPFFLGYMVIAV